MNFNDNEIQNNNNKEDSKYKRWSFNCILGDGYCKGNGSSNAICGIGVWFEE